MHLTLSAKEGPAPGTWRYNLTDGPDHRAACGRVAGKGDYLDVLRYAAGICATSYQPGTTERGLLEQFATPRPMRTPRCPELGQGQGSGLRRRPGHTGMPGRCLAPASCSRGLCRPEEEDL